MTVCYEVNTLGLAVQVLHGAKVSFVNLLPPKALCGRYSYAPGNEELIEQKHHVSVTPCVASDASTPVGGAELSPV